MRRSGSISQRPYRSQGSRAAPGCGAGGQREVQRRAPLCQEQQARLGEQEERLRELDSMLRQHQEEEKQLRRKQRELEDQKAAWDVERERMRNEIRAQEREQAQKNQQQLYDELIRRKDDDHKTEVRQLMQQVERMKAQAEETARRGATSSRQEEGVARQDVFADELRQRFPDDEVTVTQRGKPGPDVTHQVRATSG